jgi:hypothetical protein
MIEMMHFDVVYRRTTALSSGASQTFSKPAPPSQPNNPPYFCGKCTKNTQKQEQIPHRVL